MARDLAARARHSQKLRRREEKGAKIKEVKVLSGEDGRCYAPQATNSLHARIVVRTGRFYNSEKSQQMING